MDRERLRQAAQIFATMWHGSEKVKNHAADHQRRMRRAQALLRPERIPHLTEEELRELFLDTDALLVGLHPFRRRLQHQTDLSDVREALLALTYRAEAGFTAEDMKTILQSVPGLGMVLIAELLCYRFPNRYWPFSPKITPKALSLLGVDIELIKRSSPRGQRNEIHLYFALKPVMDEIVAALREVGIPEADYSTADIFLWHLLEDIRPNQLTIQGIVQLLQHDRPTPETREQAFQFLERVQERVKARLGPISSRIGPQKPSAGSRHFAQLTIPLIPNLISGKKNRQAKRDLNLEVYLLPGRLWWGVYVWTFRELAQTLADIFADLDLVYEGDQLKVKKGALEVPYEVWDGGGYFALGKDLTPAEVGQFASVDALAEHLAAEIAAYYERIMPLAETIRQRVEDAFPAAPSDKEQEQIAEALIALFPDETQRRQALQLFREAVLEAHRAHPGNWSVSLAEPKKVRLNVGRVVVMTLEPNTVWLVVEEARLSDDLRERVEPFMTPEYRYKSLPTGIGLSLAPEQAWAWREALWPAFAAFVAQAARGTTHLPARLRQAHSPAFLRYLAQVLKETVPVPEYENRDGAVLPLRGSALAQALRGVFRRQGLHFTPWQIATFYTALQTKGFVILSGISGTGKTKLARQFAAALPQPLRVEEGLAEDLVAVTVQPYMLKYGRLIIPKRATQFFTPPAPGDTQEITVHFGAQSETCRFVHAAYGDSDYLTLLLRGDARRWFTTTLRAGDTLYLDFVTDAEGNLQGLRLLSETELQRQKPPHQGRNWLFVPVRPDWRDGKSLLGYFNPLTRTYHWTPFLRFVLQAVHSYRRRDGLAWFVILDEMNLARVEYYFGDLLSVLESGRDAAGWSREPLRFTYPEDAEGDVPPPELFLPPNLYILGTINRDETTHTLSPKVLDRAFTLELNEADLEAYLTLGEDGEAVDHDPQAVLRNFSFDGRFVHLDKQAIADFIAGHPEIRAQLQRLNQALQPYDLHFGYRVFDEIIAFLLSAEHNGLYETLGGLPAALDAAVLMKVLPKFHGGRSKLEAPLRAVLAWCVNPAEPASQQVAETLDRALQNNHDVYAALRQALTDLQPQIPQTAAKTCRMLAHLYTTGFAAF